MPPPEPTPEQVAAAVYGFAAELMRDGVPAIEIEQRLLGRGLRPEDAATVVQNLHEARERGVRGAGRRNMLFGALWCVGGVVVTAATFNAAQAGGGYVVAWGAILFGAIQFVMGLTQAARGE